MSCCCCYSGGGCMSGCAGGGCSGGCCNPVCTTTTVCNPPCTPPQTCIGSCGPNCESPVCNNPNNCGGCNNGVSSGCCKHSCFLGSCCYGQCKSSCTKPCNYCTSTKCLTQLCCQNGNFLDNCTGDILDGNGNIIGHLEDCGKVDLFKCGQFCKCHPLCSLCCLLGVDGSQTSGIKSSKSGSGGSGNNMGGGGSSGGGSGGGKSAKPKQNQNPQGIGNLLKGFLNNFLKPANSKQLALRKYRKGSNNLGSYFVDPNKTGASSITTLTWILVIIGVLTLVVMIRSKNA